MFVQFESVRAKLSIQVAAALKSPPAQLTPRSQREPVGRPDILKPSNVSRLNELTLPPPREPKLKLVQKLPPLDSTEPNNLFWNPKFRGARSVVVQEPLTFSFESRLTSSPHSESKVAPAAVEAPVLIEPPMWFISQQQPSIVPIPTLTQVFRGCGCDAA